MIFAFSNREIGHVARAASACSANTDFEMPGTFACVVRCTSVMVMPASVFSSVTVAVASICSGGNPAVVSLPENAIAKQAAAEGGTEGLQTIVERAAVQWVDENKKVFSPDGWKEIINATAAGAVVGGGVGGVAKAGEGVMRTRARDELVTRLRGHQVGAAAPVTVVRGTSAVDVTVTIGERPSR